MARGVEQQRLPALRKGLGGKARHGAQAYTGQYRQQRAFPAVYHIGGPNNSHQQPQYATQKDAQKEKPGLLFHRVRLLSSCKTSLIFFTYRRDT